MTSKAQRKRRKKAAQITMPGGESIPQHVGRGNGGGPRIAEAANKSALKTRQRLFAGQDGPKDERAFLDPLWGCSVGRQILTLPEAQRATPQLNTRVARASREAYEREAQRRGISLGALVRERLESAPWCKESAT